MYTAEGEWVVAEPDKASWDQFQAKTKAAAEKAEASTSNQELAEWGLECPIDKRMFVDPVKTPCCEKTYCRECIENALLNSDFTCPGCSTEGVLVDNLIEDEGAIKKMKEFTDFKMKQESAKTKAASPKPEGQQDASTPQKAGSVTSGQAEGDPSRASKSPSVKPATPSADGTASAEPPKGPADSKKRPAEEPLESKRIPTAPAAMRRQQQTFNVQQAANPNDFAQQMNAMAANMGLNPQMNPFMNPMGFPGMMNPMMGMNPAMMMNGMGFPQMNGNMGFGQQWQGNGQNWNNQQQQNGGNAYTRQPVNQNRFQNKNRNQQQQQRDVDYRELGS